MATDPARVHLAPLFEEPRRAAHHSDGGRILHPARVQRDPLLARCFHYKFPTSGGVHYIPCTVDVILTSRRFSQTHNYFRGNRGNQLAPLGERRIHPGRVQLDPLHCSDTKYRSTLPLWRSVLHPARVHRGHLFEEHTTPSASST